MASSRSGNRSLMREFVARSKNPMRRTDFSPATGAAAHIAANPDPGESFLLMPAVRAVVAAGADAGGVPGEEVFSPPWFSRRPRLSSSQLKRETLGLPRV